MKLLYFRVGTATASEDDEATGSNVYPVENFMGACSGTSDGNGTVTDDDDAVSIFLKPIRKTQTSEAAAGAADPDVIVLACAKYGQKALIKDPGDSNLLAGEQVQKKDLLETNLKLKEEGKKPATYDNILLGITKASLQTSSFISSASLAGLSG